jgi:hypothetical protein
MSNPGLSLVGFMDESTAAQYFRSGCVLADSSDGALRAAWKQATDRLGAPIPKAGLPDIQELPRSVEPLLRAATGNPRFADTVANRKSAFKLIEIAPLLAFQFHVETDRSATLCTFDDGHTPTVAEMVNRPEFDGDSSYWELASRAGAGWGL